MYYSYERICKLFNLDEPAPLAEEQIEEIRDYFGDIPQALEDYYRLCGDCRDMNFAQNFLLTPDKRYAYNLKNFNYDSYCVFYVENQCVCEWAVKKSDLSMENPPVYETHDSGETWDKIADTVSQFLVNMAYLHAAFSFEYSSEEFYDIDNEHLRQIAEKFPLVDENPLLFCGVKYFQPYEDTVVTIMWNGDEEYMVFYSSNSEEHFQETDNFICGILGFESNDD